MPMAAPISPFSSERRKSWRPARSVSVGVSGRTSRHISWATHQPAVRNRNCNQTGDYCEHRRGIGASRRGHSARRRGIIASRDGGLLRSYGILLQEDGWFVLADWEYSEKTGVKKYWLCCASRRLSMSNSNRFAVYLQPGGAAAAQTAESDSANSDYKWFSFSASLQTARWPRKMLRFKTCYGSLFLAN